MTKCPCSKAKIRILTAWKSISSNTSGAPSKAIVADGQKVERGDKIAESADGLSLPQYASVSGYATVCEGEKIIIDKVNCNV